MNNDPELKIVENIPENENTSSKWNPQEELAKFKQNILARKRSGAMSHEDASRNYLAYKLLLEHPKMNKQTFDKHIDAVIEDFYHPSSKIINGKILRLNKNNIKSDFLKNHLKERAEKPWHETKLEQEKKRLSGLVKDGTISKLDALKEYAAHKVLLTHSKISPKKYNKHIGQVINDLKHSEYREGKGLKVNRGDVESLFLQRYFITQNNKKLLPKYKAEVYDTGHTLTPFPNIHYINVRHIPKRSAAAHTRVLTALKDYYKSMGKPMKQSIANINTDAQEDSFHPLANKKMQRIFNDLISTLKGSGSTTKSGKPGFSFRNKYK